MKKQEKIREGIEMMDEFWATDGRSRRVVEKIGKLKIKHTDLGDDIVRKNWESAEAWLNRRREKTREGFRIFIKDACSPTYDGRYTFSDSGRMADAILSYLHSQGVAIKAKCPDCEWSQFGEESVGMTPCYSCNSIGYIFEPLIKG